MTILSIARRTVVRALQPYRVLVLGGSHDGIIHHAWTYQDALNWAAMYPACTYLQVVITTRHGRFVGTVI